MPFPVFGGILQWEFEPMGKEILYCHRCGKKLISDDFTRGRAHTLVDRSYCNGCVPHRPDEAPKKSTTRRIQKTPSSARLSVRVEKSPATLILGIATIAILAIVLPFALRSDPPQPVPMPSSSPATAVNPAASADRTPEPLKRARAFAPKNPDVDEEVEVWEEAFKACEKSPFAAEARTSLDRALAKRRGAYAVQLN